MKRWTNLALFLGILLGITLPSLADSGLRMYIAGKVIDKATGKGIEGVGIWIKDDNTWQPPDVQTDEEGKFIVGDLEAGRYRIIAIDLSHGYVVSRIIPSKEVEVKDGENVWVKIEMEKGGVIEGRVVDRDGRPVVTRSILSPWGDVIYPGGELVSLNCKEEYRFSKTDSKGRFKLIGIPLGKRCTLRASFQGYPEYIDENFIMKEKEIRGFKITLGKENCDFCFTVAFPDGTHPDEMDVYFYKLARDFPLKELLSDYSESSLYMKYLPRDVEKRREGFFFDRKGNERLCFKGYPPGVYLIDITTGTKCKSLCEYIYTVHLKPGVSESHLILDWDHLLDEDKRIEMDRRRSEAKKGRPTEIRLGNLNCGRQPPKSETKGCCEEDNAKDLLSLKEGICDFLSSPPEDFLNATACYLPLDCLKNLCDCEISWKMKCYYFWADCLVSYPTSEGESELLVASAMADKKERSVIFCYDLLCRKVNSSLLSSFFLHELTHLCDPATDESCREKRSYCVQYKYLKLYGGNVDKKKLVFLKEMCKKRFNCKFYCVEVSG